jgi:hypothetical protein
MLSSTQHFSNPVNTAIRIRSIPINTTIDSLKRCLKLRNHAPHTIVLHRRSISAARKRPPRPTMPRPQGGVLHLHAGGDDAAVARRRHPPPRPCKKASSTSTAAVAACRHTPLPRVLHLHGRRRRCHTQGSSTSMRLLPDAGVLHLHAAAAGRRIHPRRPLLVTHEL